jgi:hypothetical protein
MKSKVELEIEKLNFPLGTYIAELRTSDDIGAVVVWFYRDYPFPRLLSFKSKLYCHSHSLLNPYHSIYFECTPEEIT